MKVLVAAIGKAKASPEQALTAEYMRRLPWKAACREFDIRPADKEKEAAKLLAACEGYARIVALDESGRDLSSAEFAAQLGRWQQQGHGSAAFIIGGADGLSPRVLKEAHLVWSLGRVTWPHMLVRALLAEQLYRAHSILSGHPYHRATV